MQSKFVFILFSLAVSLGVISLPPEVIKYCSIVNILVVAFLVLAAFKKEQPLKSLPELLMIISIAEIGIAMQDTKNLFISQLTIKSLEVETDSSEVFIFIMTAFLYIFGLLFAFTISRTEHLISGIQEKFIKDSKNIRKLDIENQIKAKQITKEKAKIQEKYTDEYLPKLAGGTRFLAGSILSIIIINIICFITLSIATIKQGNEFFTSIDSALKIASHSGLVNLFPPVLLMLFASIFFPDVSVRCEV